MKIETKYNPGDVVKYKFVTETILGVIQNITITEGGIHYTISGLRENLNPLISEDKIVGRLELVDDNQM